MLHPEVEQSGRTQVRCWWATGSSGSRPLFGITPVPQSAPQSVPCILHYHPGRRDFPGPVGNEDLSPSSLPSTQTPQALARVHCLPDGLLDVSFGWLTLGISDSVFRPILPLQTVSAQGSLAPEKLCSFIAITSPCADPVASHLHFMLCTYRRCPCRLRQPRLVIGTFPLWSALLSWSAAPLIPAVHRVPLASSTSMSSAFTSLRRARHSRKVPTKRFHVGLSFRDGRHSFMLRPSSLLALLTVRHRYPAPEDFLHPSFLLSRYLLSSQTCYPADWSIAGAGLSPARRAAVVGCTIVQIDVSQQRRGTAALRRPFITARPLALFQHAGAFAYR